MINRISEFIINQKLSIRQFESKIGASNGLIRKAITNKTDIQSKWISNIVDNYPQLNPLWLLTGNGNMLKTEGDMQGQVCKNYTLHSQFTQENNAVFNIINNQIQIIDKFQEKIDRMQNEIDSLKREKQVILDRALMDTTKLDKIIAQQASTITRLKDKIDFMSDKLNI